MAKSANPYRRSPGRYKECIESLPTKGEVFTIFGGPDEDGKSDQVCDRYAQEARRRPQAMVHTAGIHPARGTTQKPGDIVFTEGRCKLSIVYCK